MTAKQHPVLFNGAMVRAILADTKTQTRRPCPPVEFLGGKGEDDNPNCWGHAFDGKRGHGYTVLGRGHEWRQNHDLHSIAHPHGEAGDELWVRECWAVPPGSTEPREVAYRADMTRDSDGGPWTPSIHMPRWASRITLSVLETRVERAHSITGSDVLAEGVPQSEIDKWTKWLDPRDRAGMAFGQLWDSVYGALP